MNQYKNLFIAVMGIAVLSLASCMKSNMAPNLDPSVGTGASPTVGIDASGAAGGATSDFTYSSSAQDNPTVNFNAYNMTVKFLPSAPDTGYVNINVTYYGSGTAPQDITITLAVDPAVLASFNDNSAFSDNWGAPATMPDPADIWSIPTSVVIPKGQKTAQVRVKLKKSLPLGQPYVIPLSITNVSPSMTVASNMEHAAYVFQKVNNYDGIFWINGSLTDAQNTYVGRYPQYVELITYDDNDVILLNANYGAFYYLATSAATGGAANLGAFGFQFDPTTNKCTSIMSFNTTTGALTPTGALVSGGPNQFTPTETTYDKNPAFLINYTISSGRYTINDKYTFVSDRTDAN
jgi:hypothetical protein